MKQARTGNKMHPKWTTMVFPAKIAVFSGFSELQTDGHTDVRTDGHTDGRMNRHTILKRYDDATKKRQRHQQCLNFCPD